MFSGSHIDMLFLFVCMATLTVNGGVTFAQVRTAISVQASVEGGALGIRGRATVPDGAWIMYVAYRVAEPRTRATGYARVKDERFAAQVDVSNWRTGEIAIDAHFQIILSGRRQPGTVVARYGSKGERMMGGAVVIGGGGNRAAIASTIVFHR